jgi:hypothetical protein
MCSSFIPITRTKSQHVNYIQQKPITEIELFFAYFSLYILFPLLYNMLLSGNKSVVMVLWRYITSGVFDTVSYIKDIATDMFYASLRLFGQYTFSTYTVVKDGREVFTASSMYYYHKSDIKTVYRIDRAKYDVCKWIDKQCALYLKIHGEEPQVNDTENDIYDFILHKVENQPYVRIHRGNFTGRTHTLITEHYRPYNKSHQFASEAELIVNFHESSVEPPIYSNDCSDTHTSTDESDHECFPAKVFNINLKSPHNFFLEKNELLDVKFLKWKLYNEFGAPDIAKYLNSLFYNFKLTMYYNDCMKDKVEKTKVEAAVEAASVVPETEIDRPQRIIAYNLSDKQSVIVGHTYIVKVDSLLRCPVFESNEKQVFDIDGVLTSYYDCSDTDTEVNNEGESDSDNDETENGDDIDNKTDNKTDDNDDKSNTTSVVDKNTSKNTKTNDKNPEYDETEFEVIQESST